MQNPIYYENCAQQTRRIVELLGVPDHWHDQKCIDVVCYPVLPRQICLRMVPK